ncbi:glycoside hydrolase family 99 protein [Chryseobacterium vrystaatense]|uniref:Glycoprotein endo-alpha-1,2-mannosidase n=1 Tax=Chryseobacterium vrystaatense TaxID=307480 RepID=A0A1M5M6J0_9FLAO|nr:glycoside hydrolase family 99 protein [Chryseobacterium vrystaatense]SHG72559.1 glycoprotein endo-alpha-1,2-mannosidase [Chryseobacterium vrystaatense]
MNFKSFLVLILLICFSPKSIAQAKKSRDQVQIFYYGWYGNPAVDGKYYHWNHDILPHWNNPKWNNLGNYKGADDIGANFYPELGNYSSNDPGIIKQHMKMIKKSGVGVVVLSWLGKDPFVDKSITAYLDIADQFGLKIAFHIEPFYKNITELRDQLSYLVKTYSHHHAFYRKDGKPLYYIYDSYKISPEEWSKLLSVHGEKTVRNTELDGLYIGLWVEEEHASFFEKSNFDGFYTYFASEGFVFGSTVSNWTYLSQYAKDHHLMFIPCVGPGYSDTRIRPWNESNFKSRENGKYYEKMFKAAAKIHPDFIGITSFNEWHEGTQIEPAVPKKTGSFKYEDYGKESWMYIKETKRLTDQFLKGQ